MVSCQLAPDLGPFPITCHSFKRSGVLYWDSESKSSLGVFEAMVQSCSWVSDPFKKLSLELTL